MEGNKLAVLNRLVPGIIELTEEKYEEIIMVVGDDPESLQHGADNRDNRLQFQSDGKNFGKEFL